MAANTMLASTTSRITRDERRCHERGSHSQQHVAAIETRHIRPSSNRAILPMGLWRRDDRLMPVSSGSRHSPSSR
jgi:hypothetical protein